MLSLFSKWLCALLLLTLSVSVTAGEPTSTEGGEWLEKSRELIESAENKTAPEWMNAEPSPEAIELAEQIARDSGLRPGQRDRESLGQPGTVLIFGSFSMPEETLRNLFDEATEQDAMFVLRGLVGATNIRETLNRIKAVIGETDRVPNVVIDPTLYKRFNVSVAPTLVLVREDDLPPVTVVGAVTVDWLRRQASLVGKTGDPHLGVRAESHDITEIDLVVEMQRRLANIDWESKRKAAIDRFWKKKNDFVDLPVTEVAREFEIDPTIRVTQDIRDPDGNILVYAGELHNPLDLVPMTKTVIVFRGTDKHQRQIASQIASEVRSAGRGVILITTSVDTTDGWQSMHGMEQDLRGPVYLLQPNLASSFRLQRVPSTVTSRGNRLVVTEIPLSVQSE